MRPTRTSKIGVTRWLVLLRWPTRMFYVMYSISRRASQIHRLASAILSTHQPVPRSHVFHSFPLYKQIYIGIVFRYNLFIIINWSVKGDLLLASNWLEICYVEGILVYLRLHYDIIRQLFILMLPHRHLTPAWYQKMTIINVFLAIYCLYRPCCNLMPDYNDGSTLHRLWLLYIPRPHFPEFSDVTVEKCPILRCPRTAWMIFILLELCWHAREWWPLWPNTGMCRECRFLLTQLCCRLQR